MSPRAYGFLLTLIFSVAASAAPRAEVYDLAFRSADELIPLVQPHLGADATLSGARDHLVLRGPADAHETLRALLEELDRPPVNLRVSLRTDERGSGDVGSAGISGRVGEERADARVHVYRSESARAKIRCGMSRC